MKIETGQGKITLLALLGIWSVSALTSLPGLAVSPILGDLTTIFKHATEFDIQLLTTLPSLLIIPFILLAGRMSSAIGYVRLLYWGLLLFLLSGILYFMCDTIAELILVSALLGVGAGIITPLSTSLVSRFFVGKYRTIQFGYSSAINNLSLVAATAITGYLAEVEWRLPFLVYLLPIVSLLLVRSIKSADKGIAGEKRAQGSELSFSGINYSVLRPLMLYYLLITFLVIVISVNLPFLMQEHGHDSGTSGLVISLFFLFIMLPGFFIDRILSFLGRTPFRFSLMLIVAGLLLICFARGIAGIVAGVLLAGVGYGIAQPCIYDSAASASTADKATYAMALVMTMNYVAIVISPLIVDYMQQIIGTKSPLFPFALNACVGGAVLLALLFRTTKMRHGNEE